MRRVAVTPVGAYLAAGLALTGIYFALPRGGTAQSVLYDAIGVSSALAVVAGERLNRPARRAPWWLFAAGLLAFAVGDMLYNVGYTTSPSAADVLYLSGYPLVRAGLGGLIAGLHRADRRAGLLEAAIAAG